MIYHIRHASRFEYHKDVLLSQSLAHLTARSYARQTCLSSHLEFSVRPAVSVEQIDYFGNPATFFSIQETHRTLNVVATNVVDVHPSVPPDPYATMPWEEVVNGLRLKHDLDTMNALQFTYDSPYVKADDDLLDYASGSLTRGRPILDAVLDLTHRINEDFVFDPSATTTSTPIREVFRLKRGVCQDFAHLQIGCLRALGLAARYVSGYLQTAPPPGQKRLVGADASHAWLSVYCPPLGWIDFDPTNDQIPQEKHVVLAWGRDYDDVSPIKGVILGGGWHSLAVAVDVVSETERALESNVRSQSQSQSQT
jgi:transglutaminase-like putative cysteine protease